MAHQIPILPYSGLKANLPTIGLTANELILSTDTLELYVATGATTTATVVPDLPSLVELAFAPASDDWLMVYDIDEAGDVKMKKITANNLGAADEKVGIDSLASAGYIGSGYNDGVIRTDQSISVTDGGDYITLGIGFGSDAQGDICQRGAAIYERLAIGSAYNMLRVNAGATAVEYTTVVSGGTF